jgi:hypothetical protein
MAGALHVVACKLRPDAIPQALTQAEEAACALIGAPGAEAVLLGRSDQQLVIATWLEGRDVLEPFAASREHMTFIMQGIAPVIAGMWSAAIEVESDPPGGDTAAVWAWALPAREGVYEWQVRDLLAAIDDLPGTAGLGPTVEERERFRAAGVVCLTDEALPGFESRLAEARAAWQAVVGGLEEALVPVLGHVRRA